MFQQFNWDVWYAVRNEAKWITYNQGLKQARKRKSSDKQQEGEDVGHIDVFEVSNFQIIPSL